MPLAEVFDDPTFGPVSLTASINKLPYVPARLARLFRSVPITTPFALVEEQHGKLSILPTAPRGGPASQGTRSTGQSEIFKVPHIPHNDSVKADDVYGVHEFGTTGSTIPAVASLVNDRLATMRQNHELTHEYHRIGAIKGIVLDADGVTTVHNMYTKFGIVQNTINFDFTAGAQSMKANCQAVIRTIEEVLGAMPYTEIECQCSDSFFDALVAHANVVDAFAAWQVGTSQTPFSMQQQSKTGFRFGDITFFNYRGSVSGVPFIAAGEAHFYPVGVPDLFQQIFAPANFTEAVGTPGKPIYVKQKVQDYDTGVDLHSQSNPLMVCTRPAALVKGF